MKLEEDFYQSPYDGYWASKSGKILSTKWNNRRLLKVKVDRKGYEQFVIYGKSGKIYKSVHRMVLETFMGKRRGLECNHIDGNPKNNNLSNLEWTTKSENNLHKCRVLKKQIGEDHNNSKLKENDIFEIRKLLKSGMTQKEIAKKFDIDRSTITLINCRKTWSWLKDE